jgi:hypothetical protein
MAICSVSSIAPVSCFLFVIVMEAFSKMLTASVDGGLLLGFSVESRHFGVVSISHLLFEKSASPAEVELGFLWGQSRSPSLSACLILMF